jgi:hypothetical protein
MTQNTEFLLISLNITANLHCYEILRVDHNASSERIHEKWVEKIQFYY